MPATELALLKAAAREAGAIALRYFDRVQEVTEKPGGAGPVTAADIEVDGMLRRELMAACPGYGWLSEETEDDPARLTTGRQFIVDPIDGTRAFIDGSQDWAHSLALTEEGQTLAAVVYLPARKQMFTAMRGGGAFLNGRPINCTPGLEPASATVLSARPNFDARHWRDGVPPPVKRSFRSSLAYRMCLVAEGRFDAMLTLRPTWEWDIAAGALIVTEALGRATDRTGNALRFNNPHPQVNGVVAGGGLHGSLVSQLRSDNA